MNKNSIKLIFIGAVSLLLIQQTADADQKQTQRNASGHLTVTSVPPEVRERFSLDDFYQQCIVVEGMPIVASEKVNASAMIETAHIVTSMLKERPDVFHQLAKNRVRLSVMAASERTCDIPEHSDLTPREHWNRRARGLGATHARPSVSCAEENVLNLKGRSLRFRKHSDSRICSRNSFDGSR